MTIVSAIQMTSTTDLSRNLSMAAKFIAQAAGDRAQLVVLPEMFPVMGGVETDKLKVREIYGVGKIQDFLAEQAQKNNVWLVGGTIPIETLDAKKVRAACLVYNHLGKVVARYDKIHLFDVSLASGEEEYRESRTVEHGDKITVVDTPFGKLGLAVCYDIRFPELFRNMLNQGVEIIAVPTAFTVKTGKAHWEILARARAIENLCYAIYACQEGQHSETQFTYGSSMIVDPWGTVLQKIEHGAGVISTEIDLQYLHHLRKNFPVQTHQTIFHTRHS